MGCSAGLDRAASLLNRFRRASSCDVLRLRMNAGPQQSKGCSASNLMIDLSRVHRRSFAKGTLWSSDVKSFDRMAAPSLETANTRGGQAWSRIVSPGARRRTAQGNNCAPNRDFDATVARNAASGASPSSETTRSPSATGSTISSSILAAFFGAWATARALSRFAAFCARCPSRAARTRTSSALPNSWTPCVASSVRASGLTIVSSSPSRPRFAAWPRARAQSRSAARSPDTSSGNGAAQRSSRA